MSIEEIKIIKNRIEDNFLLKIQEKDSTVKALAPSSFFKILAGVFAPILWGLEKLIVRKFERLFPKYVKSKDEINNLLGLHLNSEVREGTYANGQVKVVVSSAGGYEIKQGTELFFGDLSYFINENKSLVAGDNLVDVIAGGVGGAYNLVFGTELFPRSPISEIDSITVELLDGGSDEESLLSAKQRLLDHFTKIKTGSTLGDYTDWALAVEGVKDVYVYENKPRLGEVVVLVTNNSYLNYIPDQTLIDSVQSALDDKRVLGSAVYVRAPLAKPVDIVLENLQGIGQAEVEEAIKKYLFSFTKPNTELYPSKIIEVISLIEGEVAHDLVSPTEFIPTAYNEVHTLGSVTVR